MPEKASGAGTHRPRILVVEDHADSAEVLALSLELDGYDVALARTLAEAEMLVERGVDVLVSDVRLPDGSGLDLMRRLRASYGLPGIAISGYGSIEDHRRSFDAGFQVHLTKPVDMDRLLSALVTVLESGGSHEP